MKHAKQILILTFALIAPALLRADFADTFHRAAQAYDAGQFGESARLYETLVNEKATAPELFFNLGNSRFKNGDTGVAVLNYRRAQYFSPRDPDINANMNYAMGGNGAVRWRESTVAHIAGSMNMRQWTNALLLIYWMTAVAAMLWMLDTVRRAVYLRIFLIFSVLAMACVSGIRHWQNLHTVPEAVIINKGLSAFFAPIENSTAHFGVPEGSLVRVHEQDGKWLKIEADGKDGWVPSENCRKVYPWIDAPIIAQ